MNKKLSESMIFSYLAMRMQSSVPDLVQQFGLPTSTVVGIITRLSDKGWIMPGPSLAGQRGRPIVTYRLKLPGMIAACQFDGTRLAGAILDPSLAIVAQKTITFDRIENIEEAAEKMSQMIRDLLESAGITGTDIQGVALSINAIRSSKRMLNSSVLPWAGEASEAIFSSRLGLPVKWVLSPGLQAEYQKVSNSDSRSMVFFSVRDGVSAHSVIEGRVYHGESGLAGELGHVVVAPEGPLCGCGRRGCLEAYCSGPAICRQILTDIQAGVVCTLEKEILVGASPRKAMNAIWQAWQNGDNYIRATMEPVFDRLGWGLGLVMNLVDPEVVMFGGYVIQDRPEWMDEIRRRAQRWIFQEGNRKTRYEASTVTLEDELKVVACNFYLDTKVKKGLNLLRMR